MSRAGDARCRSGAAATELSTARSSTRELTVAGEGKAVHCSGRVQNHDWLAATGLSGKCVSAKCIRYSAALTIMRATAMSNSSRKLLRHVLHSTLNSVGLFRAQTGLP